MLKLTIAKTRCAASVLAAMTFLSACGNMPQEVDKDSRKTMDSTEALRKQALTQNPSSSAPVVQLVRGAWLGGHAVPLQNDTALPAVFDEPGFTFRFPGRANVMTIAERLTEVAKIPVHADPDVMVPLSALIDQQGSRTAASNSAKATDPIRSLPPLPNPAAGGSLAAGISSTIVQGSDGEYEMNYTGTLRGYLELLSAQAGISWEYHDGLITLSRFVTRTFQVKAQPGDAIFGTSMVRDGSTQSGTSSTGTGVASQSNGGFSTKSKNESNADTDIWTSLKNQIETAKTPLGKYAISEATGTVTVKDTRTAVDQIQRIIDHENSLVTRELTMSIEVFQVTLSDGQDMGVNWDAVFQKVANTVPFALNLTSPASVVPTTVGNMGITFLTPTGSTQSSTAEGSTAMFSALQQYGHVKVVTSANAMTVSRRPVSEAITKQTGYLASTTPASTTVGGTGGVPGLSPGEVTTGYMLNLLPTVLDSGNILLSVSIGLSSLDQLVTDSSGSGATLQSIQTPTVSSTDVNQVVTLKPGTTLVLSGYEQDSTTDNQNSLGPSVPMAAGGSYAGNRSRVALVIMITPVLNDTAI